MSDAPPRKPNPWPILSLALLVALLSAFLYVQWRKRDERPAVVKAGPAPSSAEKPPTPGGKPAAPPAEAESAKAAREFEAKLRQARAALGLKKWDEAEKLAQEAELLLPGGPGLQDLRQEIADARRAEAARAEEERRRQDQALEAALRKVDALRRETLWDQALQTLEKLLQEFPGVAQVEEFQTRLAHMRDLQKGADRNYQQHLKDAERHLAAGAFPKALEFAEKALSQYVERRDAVKAFQERVNQAMLQRDMIRIPSAACWIGNDHPEFPDEAPLRQVKLPAFFIDKYEVTHEDYYAFLVATGRPVPARSPYWLGGKPREGREKHPVVYVSYEDAEAYARWAGKRLPTAEEWEVAARGPDRREYPWGNLFSEKENTFHCNSLEFWQVHKHLSPGTARVDASDVPNDPSPFGVYGMGGNVWEWTSTSGKVTGKEGRVLKGGSFMTDKRAIRASNLYPEDPTLGHPDVGFRCVREIK